MSVFETGRGKKTVDKRTICEVLRLIYDHCVIGLHETNPVLLATLTPLLEEAFWYGRKMSNRLIEQKIDLLTETDAHKNKEEIMRVRKLRVDIMEKLTGN